MKKGSALPPGTSASPAKRKRTNSNPMGLSQHRLGAQTWSPGLGRAPRDWDAELPDIGAASINAVKTWDEADAAASKSRIESEQKMQKKQQQQQFSKNLSSRVNVVQQDVQSSMALPGSIPKRNVSNPFFSPPMQMQNIGFQKSSSDATVVTASTVSTGASSRSGQSVASGMSFGTTMVPPLPPPPVTATQAAPPAVPKAILYQFYGKKPRRKQLSNEDYFAWNNGGRPHELKFTSIFQCPLTGECFPSGRYGDPRYYAVEVARNINGQEVEVIWYTKKAFAEHGAAAKCYDCMLYREALLQGDHAVASLSRMGMDAPYVRDHSPPLPPVPNLVAEKISQTQKRVRELMG